ncbi:MAG: hypothetical protein HQK77_13805, partial [Desulfobacterales bacterium]|nr:hypothetical protein [Desulfobacterales bacterium]
MKFKCDKKEIFFFIIFNILIGVIILWSIQDQLQQLDPEIEKKYKEASQDLSKIKTAIIVYYCKNKQFPVRLTDLVPETLLQLPIDPWGNEYFKTQGGFWTWNGPNNILTEDVSVLKGSEEERFYNGIV